MNSIATTLVIGGSSDDYTYVPQNPYMNITRIGSFVNSAVPARTSKIMNLLGSVANCSTDLQLSTILYLAKTEWIKSTPH